MRIFVVLLMAVGALQAGEIHFHGYGELHFNAPADDDNELDLHRFVIGINYAFDDNWSFDMEIDLEHAFEEPEFEFLHLDYAYMDALNLRAGLLLMPVGQLNQNHEPNLFYSVERPYTEKAIIPTTWQEPGVGVFGNFGEGFDYQAYLVAGVRAEGSDGSSGIRGWRSKGIESTANEAAFVGRLNWTRPGLQLGGSLFTGGIDQGRELGFNSNLTLYNVDFRWQERGFDLRGSYIGSSVSNADELNAYLGLEGESSVGEKQYGMYLNLGYDVLRGKRVKLVPFLQLETYDTQDGVPEGFINKDATEKDILTLGVAYYPIPRLAIKADYEQWEDGTGAERSQFNMGFGFQY